MPTLIVTGAAPEGAVRRVLDTHLHPECVHYTSDPFEISDALSDGAVLAYADAALVQVCTARGVLFEAAKRVVVLTFSWQPNPDEGADIVQQAAAVLLGDGVRVDVLDLNYPSAVRYLIDMLREV